MNVKINGQIFEAKEGETILAVCRRNKINVPTLCFHDEFLNAPALCRMCLVEVKFPDGKTKTLPACSSLISAGTEIFTVSEKLKRLRPILEDLNYNIKRKAKKDLNTNPFWGLDYEKCVLCRRCVSACNEITVNGALNVSGSGASEKIDTVDACDPALADCEFCGNCAAVCPTGAIFPKKLKKGAQKTATICPYCGCGCGLYLETDNGKIVGVSPNPAAPFNGFRLCAKGRFGVDFVHHKDRLKYPLIAVKKNGVKIGKFKEISWEEALGLIAEKILKTKKTFGPEAIGGISSSKCANEENYLFQKIFRLLGTNNIENSARLCHSSSVFAMSETLGTGAMTNTAAEIKNAEAIFVIGSDTEESHPVVSYEIKRRKLSGGKLVVIDAVETGLAKKADLFLNLRSGTDVALFNGMMNVIISENIYDKDFVAKNLEGFERLKETVKNYPPVAAEKITGVPAEKIIAAARIYAKAKSAMCFWGMGLSQYTRGVNNVRSLINLCLICGQIGREGTGLNPLRGQNNVQGAADMGASADKFPGYQKVSELSARQKFEKLWGTAFGAVKLSAKPGLTTMEMFEAALKGDLKFLYVMGENPALSNADLSRQREALKKLEFLVVQDLFLTETAKFADIILPASSFAEKEGTFTNTDRLVQKVNKAIEPLHQSKPDWEILNMLGRKLGLNFDYKNPSEIFNEIALAVPQYAGMDYKCLEEKNGVRWPCPQKGHSGTRYLFAGGFGDKKLVLRPVEFLPPAELPDENYPFILTTGRSRWHWHTGEMTRRTDLDKAHPKESALINPKDAKKLRLKNGDKIKIASRRGEVSAAVKISKDVSAGEIFMTFHFRETAVNLLTGSALDAESKIPEFKFCAVKITKAK